MSWKHFFDINSCYFFAETSFVYAIKYPHLVNLSIMTNTVLCFCSVIGFFDFNSLVIKSHNMTFHSPLSVLTGCNFLYSLYFKNLFFWQFGYSLTTFFIMFHTSLMMYSIYSLAIKAVTPLCLCVVPLWNSVTNFSASFFGIYIDLNCVFHL